MNTPNINCIDAAGNPVSTPAFIGNVTVVTADPPVPQQLEFNFAKVQFPAITNFTFPAITESNGSNQFIGFSK